MAVKDQHDELEVSEEERRAIQLAFDILDEASNLPDTNVRCSGTHIDNGDMVVDLNVNGVGRFCGTEVGKVVVTVVSASSLKGDQTGIPVWDFAKPARVVIGVTGPRRGPVSGQPDVLASFGIERERAVTAFLGAHAKLGELMISRDPKHIDMLRQLSARLIQPLLANPSANGDDISTTYAGRVPVSQIA